jgi:WD40 repeat protein
MVYKNSRVSKKRRREVVAPNNYDQLQGQGSNKSHHCHVAALSFFQSGHFMASVGGKDGELLLWDLRSGCLFPSKFVAPGGMEAAARKQRRVALLTTAKARDDSNSCALWIARKGEIMGYSMQGGSPKQILKGHLQDVTALQKMEPGRRILSGGADGMVLCWGQPHSAVSVGRPVAEVHHDKDNW